MVETGHFPSWPAIEIRRPWSSSSDTLTTVPAFPSIRTTALPISSASDCCNACRITDARCLALGETFRLVIGERNVGEPGTREKALEGIGAGTRSIGLNGA